MPYLAILGSEIFGRTTGEHHGHINSHSPGDLTGTITTGSDFMKLNGDPVALVGSETYEVDNCGTGVGTVATGSEFIKVNKIPVARVGDEINPHNGYANITTGSDFVKEV